MKQLEIEQLENIEGGACSDKAVKAIAVIGAAAGVGSLFGPIGALIFGPTALAMSVAGVVCAYAE
ncbi:hypothetical protein [Roseimarinus sediminis]|jgi:hypothetical protein|uniref:hypothetical protein n=1 Tax=Roseimarinus sediminis TaxID=1610899 RepID=UPI003D1D8314